MTVPSKIMNPFGRTKLVCNEFDAYIHLFTSDSHNPPFVDSLREPSINDLTVAPKFIIGSGKQPIDRFLPLLELIKS